MVIGLLVVIIVATVVSATVGVRWTSSSGGGGIRFSEQHEIKPTPEGAVVLLGVEAALLLLTWRWRRDRS